MYSDSLLILHFSIYVSPESAPEVEIGNLQTPPTYLEIRLPKKLTIKLIGCLLIYFKNSMMYESNFAHTPNLSEDKGLEVNSSASGRLLVYSHFARRYVSLYHIIFRCFMFFGIFDWKVKLRVE